MRPLSGRGKRLEGDWPNPNQLAITHATMIILIVDPRTAVHDKVLWSRVLADEEYTAWHSCHVHSLFGLSIVDHPRWLAGHLGFVSVIVGEVLKEATAR